MEGTLLDERLTDNVKVLPLSSLGTMSAVSLQQGGTEVRAFTKQKTQPWEFTVGEMGDWLRRYS